MLEQGRRQTSSWEATLYKVSAGGAEGNKSRWEAWGMGGNRGDDEEWEKHGELKRSWSDTPGCELFGWEGQISPHLWEMRCQPTMLPQGLHNSWPAVLCAAGCGSLEATLQQQDSSRALQPSPSQDLSLGDLHLWNALEVPTPRPASPHCPHGKYPPWDVCSWFSCLLLCLLRCCTLMVLEWFHCGTPTVFLYGSVPPFRRGLLEHSSNPVALDGLSA